MENELLKDEVVESETAALETEENDISDDENSVVESDIADDDDNEAADMAEAKRVAEAEDVADEYLPQENLDEAEQAEQPTEPIIEQPKEDIWKQKYEQLQRETIKTIKAFGIEVNDTESVEDILDKTQAEFEGISVDEYRKKKEERELIEKSRALIEQQKYEQICAMDLIELKKSFPQLATLKHIREIGNLEEFKKFGELRDKGLTVKEAYMATVGEKLMNTQELAARQAAIKNSKEHLKATTTSKQTAKGYESIPEVDKILWKGYFPNLSKNEIAELYFASKKQIN